MARKIKFALEMADGAKVRGSIEELREHFDLEKAVGYFLSGKLVEWLEDRFYEDEAEALEAIDKDAPDLRERLCEALDVPYEGDSELDVAALERLNEKKAILRQKTGDEEIISHAAQTAFNQEDLADLLEMDEPVIYLCGEKFNIPARVKNKRYVGILGTPTISIKATSQEEVGAKGIVFENVQLPWAKEESNSEGTKACPKCGTKNPKTAKFCNNCGATMNEKASVPSTPSVQMTENSPNDHKKESLEMMNNLFDSHFHSDKWLFLKRGYSSTQQIKRPSSSQQAMCIKLVCKNKYSVNDIVHMCMDVNFTVGWALTYDSFCVGGKGLDRIVKYTDIVSVKALDSDRVRFDTNNTSFILSGEKIDSNIMYDCPALASFLTGAAQFAKLETESDTQDQPQPTKESSNSEKEWRVPKQQLITVFKSAFKQEFETNGIEPESVFVEVIEQGGSCSYTELTGEKRETALLMLGKGRYTEDEIIHLRISDDLSRGWAFTRDSFCIVDPNDAQGGGAVSDIIPYAQLSSIPVSDEKTVNKWFSTPMWRLIIEGDCMVLNECGIFLPDGSATMYFDYMLTNNDYSKAKETVAALKKYLGTMSNLFR